MVIARDECVIGCDREQTTLFIPFIDKIIGPIVLFYVSIIPAISRAKDDVIRILTFKLEQKVKL